MKRAAPPPRCEPGAKRSAQAYCVPQDVVGVIWSLMSLHALISARRVCKRWKSGIDLLLAPKLEQRVKEIKAGQAALALRRKDLNYEHVEWSEREYRLRAAFGLGYTHMLASEFSTASKGRKSLRRLKFENVPASAIVRLMSNSKKYGWANKDYAHALAIAIVERKFDAVAPVLNMMRAHGLRVDLRAAKLAVEEDCGVEIAGLLSYYCTDTARKKLAEYEQTLLME